MPPIDGLQLIWPERFDVVRQQQRVAAHAGSRQRRLGAGMAATDDDDIEFTGVVHGAAFDNVAAGRRGGKRRF